MPEIPSAADQIFGVLFGLALLVGSCTVVWLALSRKALFVIRFSADGVQIKRGSPTRKFVSALEELRQECAITRGAVTGEVVQKRIRVVPSSNLSPAIRQRIRNLWSIYG